MDDSLRTQSDIQSAASPNIGEQQVGKAWSRPVLERLSLKATETSNTTFLTDDGGNNYS